MNSGASVLVVDLNNFAFYPTIPVGILIATLRQAGHSVAFYSPLSVGVTGFKRQTRSRGGEHWLDLLRFWSAMTHSGTVRRGRDALRKALSPRSDTARQRIVAGFAQALTDRPDIVLISAYTVYRSVVGDMARLCAERDIPVIVGGPYFNEPTIQARWVAMTGIAGVVAGEPEAYIDCLVRTAANRGDISVFPGVATVEHIQPAVAPPGGMASVPVPDYSDFPWDAYPIRTVPVMTARGCGWGACQFCSDVTTVMGRSFRSRQVDRVFEEIATLTSRHRARHLVFHDLKLNSDLAVWHGLIDHLAGIVPDPVWTCAVHVGGVTRQGLSLEELRAARNAGLSRITTGLESGSQRVLNAMGKGMRVAQMADFCRNATAAGLSVRLTAIVGFPGEQPADLLQTARFLEDNGANIERVMVNRFSMMLGTPITERIRQSPDRFPDLVCEAPQLEEAIIPHRNAVTRRPGYYQVLLRVLRAANAINRRPLSAHAKVFDGVM